MPPMDFEPTISVFKQSKTFHALDHSSIVIGSKLFNRTKMKSHVSNSHITRSRCITLVGWYMKACLLCVISMCFCNSLDIHLNPVLAITKIVAMHIMAVSLITDPSLSREIMVSEMRRTLL